MIVNAVKTGWEVIYQPAHALLAARIAAHWRMAERPERWIETLVALAQHDDEASEWQGRNHLTATGAPLDYKLSQQASVLQPRQVTQDLEQKGQWAALLISMHTLFLWGDLADESQEFADFIAEQLEKQKRWRASLKVSKKEAEAAYALFQWCDQMSLILCQHELPDGERSLEVAHGPDKTVHQVCYQDEVVRVTPWPFEEDSFTVTVEALYLSQLSFADDDELAAVLNATPVKELSWTFSK